MSRRLSEIGDEIAENWTNTYFGAEPYLKAVREMQDVDQNYGLDTGRDIVMRFLCNANSWRGEVARRIKAELRAML